LDTKFYKTFARFLTETADSLRNIHRWTHYRQIPEHERESVETHSLTTVWLAGAMLAIERKLGAHALNDARILLAAALHDVGEGVIGDVRYALKIDPRLKDHIQAIESEHVGKMFQGFPQVVRDAFAAAYAVESEKSLDGRFFKGIERIGYILYAVPQVKIGRTEFIQVFGHQHQSLLDMSKEFESVRLFYEPYREYVEEKLADYETRRHCDDG